MVYSILLTTKLEKAAQKHKGKETLNLSWKSEGMITTFKFLNLVSVAYETNIFTGNKNKKKTSQEQIHGQLSISYFLKISNKAS